MPFAIGAMIGAIATAFGLIVTSPSVSVPSHASSVQNTKVIEAYECKRVNGSKSYPLQMNIVVDPATGVEYIYAFSSSESAAITPRLNKDGKIMIYEENK